MMLHTKSTPPCGRGGTHPFAHESHLSSPGARAFLVAVVAWSLGWKGASLWRAAKNDSRPWFVALLLSNTLGILDAVYLFGVDTRRRRHDRDEHSVLDATGEPEQLGHLLET
ncbi:MAG: DUF5652 family protein [Leifsonia sp.]